ncbi:ABC transporter substrate-binding protein [Marinicrinis sediminis]|uniref:ABC transporter substrate-binding protein n=1 Tax=Marinicrinis sediminis TaxID=1652465 RepID=A0ABW5REX2_9BACL
MKKWSAFLLVIVFMMSVLLTACGGNNNNNGANNNSSSNAGGNQADSKEEVELNIISWRTEDKAFYDEVHDMFMEEYPHIKLNVDVVQFKDYDQLLNARMATNSVDIVSGNYKQDVKNPTRSEMWLDLSGEGILDNFQEDVVQLLEFNGKQLMVPWFSLTFPTFYNTQIFEELGLDVPTTWDEFLSVSDQIQAAGIDPIVFGGKDQWPVNMIIIQLEQSLVRGPKPNFYENMRSEETKFSDPEWVSVYDHLQQLSAYFQKNAAGMAYSQAPGLFAQGKAAMMIDGSWAASSIQDANPEFEVGVFNFPGSDNKEWNQNISVKINDGWLINKNTENKEAALAYLEFFSRKDIYQKFIDFTKAFPVQADVTMDDPLATKILDLMNSHNQITNWEELNVPGATISPDKQGIPIILNDMTPEEAAEKMQKEFINSKENWE